MKLKTITIQNFLSIKHVTLELDNQGLVLLKGKNLDAPGLNNNGAGKSSVLEAIVYAIYGRTIRGLKGDSVIHRIPKKNMKIFLDLEDDDGAAYRIARYRKHSVNKNKSFIYRNGTDITPKSEADVNSYIADLLQADYLTFTSSILYSAESFKFTSATDSEMKATFEKMLGLDVYKKCQEIAKNRLRTVAADLDVTNTNLYALGSKIVDLDKQIAELTQDKNEYVDKQNKKIEELKKKYEHLNAEIVDYRNQAESWEKKKESDAQKEKEAEGNLKELNQKLKSVEEKRLAVQATEDDISSLERTIKKHKYNIKEQTDIVENNTNKVDKRNNKIKGLMEQKETLDKGVGMPCPTCGQPMTAESLEPAKKELDEQILECKQLIVTFQNRIKEAKTNIKNSEEIIKECEEESLDLQHAIKELKAEIDESKELIQAQSETEELVYKYHKNATADAEKIKMLHKYIKDSQEGMLAIQKDIKEAEEEKNPYDKMIDKCQSDKRSCQKNIDALTAKVKDKVEEREILEFWAQAYSNTGIKSYILDDITPFLNKCVNKYLRTLTDGHIEAKFVTQQTLKSGEKREKFGIEIINADGGHEYSANSGGEKKRVDLAVNLALQDLLASRSSKRMNIAIFDEIFDALDSEGIEKVADLLQELSAEKSSIFVVSHNEQLQNYFENTITVVKQGGFSTLEGR